MLYLRSHGKDDNMFPVVNINNFGETVWLKRKKKFRVYHQFHKVQYSKTCLKRPLKRRPKIGTQDRLLLNAGKKYCRMLQREHPAILSTFIKLPFAIKIFVLSNFEWPLKTGFTVNVLRLHFSLSVLISGLLFLKWLPE